MSRAGGCAQLAKGRRAESPFPSEEMLFIQDSHPPGDNTVPPMSSHVPFVITTPEDPAEEARFRSSSQRSPGKKDNSHSLGLALSPRAGFPTHAQICLHSPSPQALEAPGLTTLASSSARRAEEGSRGLGMRMLQKAGQPSRLQGAGAHRHPARLCGPVPQSWGGSLGFYCLFGLFSSACSHSFDANRVLFWCPHRISSKAVRQDGCG